MDNDFSPRFRHPESLVGLPDRMPWGRFKDRPLTVLPPKYLGWLLDLPQLDPALHKAALYEEAMRDGANDQWEGR